MRAWLAVVAACGGTPAQAPDAAPTTDAAICYGDALFRVCLGAAPTGTPSLAADVDTDTDCTATVAQADASAPGACLIEGDRFAIASAVRFHGSRVPVVIAATTITLDNAVLDAGSELDAGAAADFSGCVPPANGTANGGGGGGTFGTAGGDGGNGDAGIGGSTAPVGAHPTFLRGGCPGAAGGAAGGHGGGAIALLAGESILIDGTTVIDVSGGGGAAAVGGGGGGGGAGGMIDLVAPVVDAGSGLQFAIVAFGGGGGGGGATASAAMPAAGGAFTKLGVTPAGGVPVDPGGRGGDGFPAVTAGAIGTAGGAGGGGGGGAGEIRIVSPEATYDPSHVSPQPI